jgi:hypothetical protein
MIMSDTQLIEFLDRRWLVGLGLAAALGTAAGVWLRPGQGDGRRYLTGRLLQALTEAGLFLVLPVTAVWQAATDSAGPSRCSATGPSSSRRRSRGPR